MAIAAIPTGKFELITTVVKQLINEGKSPRQAIRAVSLAPMELAEEPWRNLLWDPGNSRMLNSAENQKVAFRVLHLAVGGDINSQKYSKSQVREELAGIQKQEVGKVRLLIYVK